MRRRVWVSLCTIVAGGCDCGGETLKRAQAELSVDPPSLDFGELPEGQGAERTVSLYNQGTRPIALALGTRAPFSLIDLPGSLGPGETVVVSVRFDGAAAGLYSGAVSLGHDADRGPAEVPLSAEIYEQRQPPPPPPGARRLCVAPAAIQFGATTGVATRPVTLQACGDSAVTVQAIAWSVASAELDLQGPPATPLTLAAHERRTLTVRYRPVDQVDDRAVLAVRSDDEQRPTAEVEVTGSADVVPVEVGRYLYFWRVTQAASDIVKLPLQGGGAPRVFWGESSGQGCPGCHQVSPDGRYVAVVELDDANQAQSYVVDTTSNARLDLQGPAAHATGFSWRPDVGGTPRYRLAFASGGRVHTAALFDGYLGELPGADDGPTDQGMPSWSSDGRIAFVRGEIDEENLVFVGPCDLYTVPEAGGGAVAVRGASRNGRASYYPAFSPDARWIAYNDSNSEATYAAPDAQVKLVRADGSGLVLDLDVLNGSSGATTYPSWSIDGTHLSVASNRAGGVGDWDVYVAPIDPGTGADGPAVNVPGANSAGFEHAAQWSP